MNANASSRKNLTLLVIVAALGYFVDIYDLVLFSVVRIQSFRDIGVPESEMRVDGEYVLNMQMAGLLLGGILWGVIGDKFGRVKVLFGSILVYSVANCLNGLVTDINAYAIIRFVAGIGLAGELGAGITLVSESMSTEKRGYGTMIVAGVGLFGAAAAATVAKEFSWQTAYFVGGGMGFVLLLMRIGTFESGMFKEMAGTKVSRGNISLLFTDRKRFVKYLHCILIGVPLWYVVGILVTQSPEFGKALNATEPLNAGTGILFTYLGIAIGDVFAGLLAQLTKSRRLTMLIFQVLSIFSVILYLSSQGISEEKFTWLCLFMGFSVGYWANFVTIASEQFGTNIRSTVTTTVPNFVRGSLIPITFLFELFVKGFGILTAGYIMIFLLSAVALFSLSRLKESFSKDLNYVEEESTGQYNVLS
ncbi:MFS transporter [Rubrolithibacter danxiaensis]|uniref:MFS transporter n=1 Tax=Rubrolithibacter danxiaensis TaxID=3390805 RepID=UPI003BF877BB